MSEPSPPARTTLEVLHHPSADGASGRFEAWVDGLRCEVDYRRAGGEVWFTHTGVPPALEGRGLAGQLVRHALAWARGQTLKVHPECSYVAVYMRRHPETEDLRA